MPQATAQPTPRAAGTAVACTGLTKRFGDGAAAVQALRGIDLEVREGELLMLVGPSGCGKTTLISIIAGVLGWDSGRCEVLGSNFQKMRPAQTTTFRGHNIGFVFQAFNLIPALTAAENVAAPLLINGTNSRTAVTRAESMLHAVGFDQRMMRANPPTLSGGEQQRVAIARALVHEPRLVICDEPTSALDAETGHRIMLLMRNLALGSGRALIVVTHDARILAFADRVARMEDGRITSFSEPVPSPALPPTHEPVH